MRLGHGSLLVGLVTFCRNKCIKYTDRPYQQSDVKVFIRIVRAVHTFAVKQKTESAMCLIFMLFSANRKWCFHEHANSI